MTAMTATSQKCDLEPISLHDADQFAEIQRQRLICGWHYDEETLQKWKAKQQDGLKNLFWIIFHNFNNRNSPIRAGHISLDAYCDPPELDIARGDKSVLTISSFFILPEYRAYGLGRRAMSLIEEMAIREPYGSTNCRSIALTALSKRYIYEEGPEWRGMWERIGSSMPSFSIQEWYEKIGYVSWKEEPLYEEKTLDGGVITLWEAFMRKML